MKAVHFCNDVAVEYLDAYEEPDYTGGVQNRRAMTIYFDPEAIAFEELSAIVHDAANLETLTMTNDEFCTAALDEAGEPVLVDGKPVLEGLIINQYANYDDFLKLSLEPVSVGEDEYGAPVYEEQLVLKLGRRTPAELEQRATAKELAALKAALAEAKLI